MPVPEDVRDGQREKAESARPVKLSLADRQREIAKVLQVKRWQPQESPFRGFGSPPGRF